MTIDSGAFVARLRSGEPDAVEQLRSQMHEPLTRLYSVYGFDETEALSLADWAIIVALQNIDSFESRARLSTWVYGLAKNVGRRARRNRLELALPRDVLDDPQLASLDDPTLADSPALACDLLESDAFALRRSNRHVLARRAWIALKKTERRVLLETGYLGMTPAEIARRENVSIGTVWSRCCRARQKLSQIYRLLAAEA